jgi:hypothetical protein
MLAYSPPLPLIIDFYLTNSEKDFTAKDEEGLILALEKRDRVRRVRLLLPFPRLQKIIPAIDEEYPVLEYLIIGPSPQDNSTELMLPERFQAPRLCHLLLKGFAIPMESRLLMAAMGLVTLTLIFDHHPDYFLPSGLLQWLSFMPQLETFRINFLSPVSDDEVERQLMQMPTMTHFTLPSLHKFVFQGSSAYVGALAPWLSTPHLEELVIDFYHLAYSVPPFLQLTGITENLRFDSVKLEFDFSKKRVFVGMYLREEVETYALSMFVYYRHLDWLVSFLAHLFNSLSQILSAVEHLTFEHKLPGRPSEEHTEVDRSEWRRLLMPFTNVKTLCVNGWLVKELSRCLRLENGEDPLELLPKLQELTYWGPILGGGHARDGLTSFTDARQNAGCPVTLMRRRYLKIWPLKPFVPPTNIS